MGSFAWETAAEYQVTRADQDAFASASLERAQQAQKSGAFDREIAPVEVATRNGITTIALDEQPAKVAAAKIPKLRPAFAKAGTITAANASSISHRPAALVPTPPQVPARLVNKPITPHLSHHPP